MQLVAEGLSARRGEALIFKDVSFSLAGGEALVVKGANGSGKSTLLRVLAGLLAAAAGSVRFSTAAHAVERVAEAAHYLGHRNAMKRELTVAENLSFWQRHFGDFPEGKGVSVEEATEAVGLGGIAHLPFGYLSAGQQRRMAMAKLLVAWRPVWLLDEPTAALDAHAETMFTDLVTAHLKRGGILVAATHQPLGLADVQVLRMQGFGYAEVDPWA